MADESSSAKSKSLRRCSLTCSPCTVSGNGEPKTRRVSEEIRSLSFDNYRGSTRTFHPTVASHHHNGRRVSRSPHDEGFNCSQQSILSAMDRFVKTVNNMNATVLVPSKLRDMDVTGHKVTNVPPALANTDLYSFFLMLNDVKKELLWGPGTAASAVATMAFSGSDRCTTREVKHVRQPSDDSLGSLGSTASSSDPETDSDVDSMITDRDSIDEHTSHLAAAFRHHLQGLHTILHQLADSADYLLSRYQEDIEAASL
ncbi:Mid1-interacting protein-like protein [Dinothrombium tinctorium]|uniref:Mid1-interacting protein-like protein n=1 Tax=Dinothrombium tinctorium TaxID=1965070 RepID=A0A3S3RJ12_9ACAR|nr:Mid1-interacting protein-like protein [Dinothrombium tinctorium]RWS01560.1 Mid1-interacting protein-like protein [Dinothrombium tinctorium]